MGTVIIKAPVIGRFGITGESQEVARGSDIWIPSQDHLEFEVKSTRGNLPPMMSSTGSIVRPMTPTVEGYSVSSVGNETINVIIGNFRTPQTAPLQAATQIAQSSRIDADLNQVLVHVLLLQLGGKATIMPDEVRAVEGRGILKTVIQEPFRWKVELV